MTGSTTERVHPRDIRDRDVIQDPDSGDWITVTRIVSGTLKATELDAHDTQEASTALWSFYGDERLNEVITVYSDEVAINRRT
jgi:hypothetical protein